MNNVYTDKNIDPMLIGSDKACFDSKDYIFELKFDGVRCLLYYDGKSIDFRNKRHLQLTDKFPELSNVKQYIKKRCILDGELHIFNNGVNNFFEVQKRCLTSDKFKIRLHANNFPACYTAFDVLYIEDTDLSKTNLISRKKLLDDLIVDSNIINISRYIDNDGIKLFELAKSNNLEGIVAKRKDSLYYYGKRTKEWIKCKNLLDDDFIIVGYIDKGKGVLSLILAQYSKNKVLVYKGHVTMGASFKYIKENSKKSNECPFESVPIGNDDAIWIQPHLVGIVKFMEYTSNNGLRQPIFKGFRNDKNPTDCIEQ